MWPMLLAAGGGALLGMENQKYKVAQQKDNMLANAEALRYSPWTHMNPGMMKADTNSPLMAAAQGGLTGAMMGSQFGGGAATPEAKPDAIMAAGASDVNQNPGLGNPSEMVPAKNYANPLPGQNSWAGMMPVRVASQQPNFYSTGSPWQQMPRGYG